MPAGVEEGRSKVEGVRLSAYCAVVLALCWVGSLRLPAAAACDLRAGQQVVLASTSPDPDVFIWDSRARLVDYAAGVFDNAKAVMAHTTLAKPGTRALVMSCENGIVHPKYADNAFDAVGVRLMTGPYRGHYGWVASEDVHALRADRLPAGQGH